MVIVNVDGGMDVTVGGETVGVAVGICAGIDVDMG
jgi:hypothetical protein